jgi:hypothetical protein
MKLSELGEWKKDASEKASSQVRALAFGGLAIVWLFAGPFFEGVSKDRPDRALFIAAAALVLALAVDLVQIVARTLILDIVYSRRERSSDAQAALDKGKDPDVTNIGPWLNRITGGLFYIKVLALAVAYGCISVFFVSVAASWAVTPVT